MATTPKRPKPYSWAVDRELITLAKTLSLETIVKRTGRKSETVLKWPSGWIIHDRNHSFSRALSATVILVCLDGPVEITVQIRVTGITGGDKSGTRPAAGWVRCITLNTWSPPRSWIGPDMPGPDMLAPVGFTQVADGYDFTGNLGDRQGPRDWRSKCDGGGNKQGRASGCEHDLSHRSLSIPSWDTAVGYARRTYHLSLEISRNATLSKQDYIQNRPLVK